MNNIRLSYSKLVQFDECPRAFYLEHIAGVKPSENFYSQYGSLVHDVLRKYLSGEIHNDAAEKDFTDRFSAEVTAPFPSSLEDATQDYFMDASEYLSSMRGIMNEPYEVLEVERKRTIQLFWHPFSGIIDLLVRTNDGSLVLIDHKSSSSKSFSGKSGLKKFNQLYIYSEFVKRDYGKFPDRLVFNCFRDGKLIGRDFSESEFTDSMEWVKETTSDIDAMLEKFQGAESEWPASQPVRFFCQNVCSVSDGCDRINSFEVSR